MNYNTSCNSISSNLLLHPDNSRDNFFREWQKQEQMKYFDWDENKNDKLKKGRNISFEIIVSQIELGNLLDIIEQPDKEKYKNQSIYIVEYENYAYLVPFVEDEEKVFLKTIIPSRKATKKYLGGKKNEAR